MSASFECREQVPTWQPNHIYIERRLRWTRQLDRTVCYSISLHNVCVLYSSVMNRQLDYTQITSLWNETFAGLGGLTYLFATCTRLSMYFCFIIVINRSLEGNPINLIEIGAFSGLSKLSTL